jgi:copper chaperone CopZ
MEQLALEVAGMHCGACIRRLAATLEKIPGVQVRSVEIGSARLEYDPSQISMAAITAAIEKIGFSAVAQNG